MSTNKYYLIKKNISELFPNDCLEWELKPFNIIKNGYLLITMTIITYIIILKIYV